MPTQKSKRKRGIALTDQGLRKLQAAIRRTEDQENYGKRFTLEDLSDLINRNESTIRKILNQGKVERRSLEDFFGAFDLQLDEGDVTHALSSAQSPDSSSRLSPLQTASCVDWGDAIDASIFYGRTQELETLQHWALNDRCRLIAILGMGGIGKTALSIQLSERIHGDFDYFIWRSLRDAPPVEKTLIDLLSFVSGQQEMRLPETIGESVTRLIHYLQQYRCLLVLDNVESILQGGVYAGQYRDGYEGYGTLLQRIGESRHQSCLVITSREKPREVARQEGAKRMVRSLLVKGLKDEVGREFLRAEGWPDADAQWQQIFTYYGGNPLALKIAVNTIQDMFGGNLTEVLQHGMGVFGDIQDLLEQQFERLSQMGQAVMYWLAINREPTSVDELKNDILEPMVSPQLVRTLESLRRRSLIERSHDGFTLQNVVMEFVTDRFVSRVSQELAAETFSLLTSHPLIKAIAKDYIRDTQIRLILTSIAKNIAIGITFWERNKKALCNGQSSRPERTYGVGNILNLLIHQGIQLNHLDVSQSYIAQAYLQGVPLHHVNFSNSVLENIVFTRGFKRLTAMTLCPEGNLLALGNSRGEIHIWKTDTVYQVMTLNSHADCINALEFTSDSQRLMSVSDDQTMTAWDISSQKLTQKFKAHNSNLTCLSVSDDATLAATGSLDGTIKIWSLEHFKCLIEFSTDYEVFYVKFSADGLHLISAGISPVIEVWDLNTRNLKKRLYEHSAEINFLDFVNDGQNLVSGSHDKIIKIWDSQLSQPILEMSGERPIAVSSSGEFLLTYVDKSIEEGRFNLWNIKQAEIIKVLPEIGTLNQIGFGGNQVMFGSDDTVLVVADPYNMAVKFRDLNTGNVLRVLQGYSQGVEAIAFSTNSRYLAIGCSDRKIRIWDLEANQFIHYFEFHHKIHRLVFSGNSDILACQYSDQVIKLWDVINGQCVETVLLSSSTPGRFSRNGKKFAQFKQGLNGANNLIQFWNIESKELVNIDLGELDRYPHYRLSPDGQKVAWLTKESQGIMVFDSSTKTPDRLSIREKDGLFNEIAFSPDSTSLACSNLPMNNLGIWDLGTGDYKYFSDVNDDIIGNITFSSDGAMIATGHDSGCIKIWDVETGQCLKELSGHTASISHLWFSSDGRFLASRSGLGEVIKVWDIRTTCCVKTLDAVNDAFQFSPDNRIFVISRSGTIEFFNTETGELLHTLPLPRLYEGMNIHGVMGLTEAQKVSLFSLGAIDRPPKQDI